MHEGPPPQCLEKRCSAPPDLPFAEVVEEGGSSRQKATYSCLPGYNQIGDDTIVCNLGKWSQIK